MPLLVLGFVLSHVFVIVERDVGFRNSACLHCSSSETIRFCKIVASGKLLMTFSVLTTELP